MEYTIEQISEIIALQVQHDKQMFYIGLSLLIGFVIVTIGLLAFNIRERWNRQIANNEFRIERDRAELEFNRSTEAREKRWNERQERHRVRMAQIDAMTDAELVKQFVNS